MITGGRKAAFLLFLGDLLVFVFSLWLTLVLRYGALPTAATLASYYAPFGFLFVLWVLVFFMAGLYGKNVILFRSELPNTLLRTQALNIVLAALFFFLAPEVGIAPKTNLIIYLVVSLALVYLWRLVLYPRLSGPRTRLVAALFASGAEAEELAREVNGNDRYHPLFSYVSAPGAIPNREKLAKELRTARPSIIVVDTRHPGIETLLPMIYEITHLAHGSQFAEFADVYEEVFDRVPLSLLGHAWFLTNVAVGTPLFYALTKRAIDIVGGLLMGVVTVAAIPFVWLANLLEGPGPLFIAQERLGQGGVPMKAYKFRSMRENDPGAWKGESANVVTRVGSFLRTTSLDEFPQFLNILAGDLSLVGPRNDIKGLGERLQEALPYYDARYLVKPGITGWAQINQQYEQGNLSPQSIEETKTRLAYDFYYLKHRSLGLDIIIALKTIKRMLFRVSHSP